MSESKRAAAPDAGRDAKGASSSPFEDTVRLAAHLLQAPIAGVSLVDAERQWFKAVTGLDAGSSRPREDAFCAFALESDEGVLMVEDAAADPRFAEASPVVGGRKIRFYAGAVLSDRSGRKLGVLCVMDTQARPTPSDADLQHLRALGRLVAGQLERSHTERRAFEQQRLLGMAEAMSGLGRWRYELGAGRAEWSQEVFRIYGRDPARFNPSGVDPLEHSLEGDREQVRGVLRQAVADRSSFELELSVRRPDGEVRDVLTRGACELDEDGSVTALHGVVQDITDSKRALRDAERGRARYKLLADNMADVVTRIRLDGTSNYISPAIQGLLGYAPAEMAGKPAQAFVYEPDRALILGAFAELAAGRDDITLQHRAEHRDGRPVWVETRFRLVRDEAGRPHEMVAVIRGVADRKRLQDRLEASEVRAQKVIDGALQAIVTIDGAGVVVGWNRFAEATFGWTAAEALGASLTELIVPADHQGAHSRGMARFLKTGEATVLDTRIEVPARRKNGEIFPIELAVTGAEGPEGWLFTALMHDITERKAQREEFETAFHNASVGMALVTTEGRFSKVNSAFCAIIGYPEDEALHLNFQSITHADDLGADLEQREQVSNGAIPNYSMDKRYIRKDGRPVWVHMSVSLVRAADATPRHFIVQVQDLTARVQAQEALEQQTVELAAMATQLAGARDAAESANRAKSEFLANMSHELRTPLNGVVGFSRILVESTELSETDRRRVQQVHGAGEALNSLINDVLDFSKLEARAVQLEARDFSVEELVSEALSMVEPQAGEKRVSLQVAGDQAGVLVGDPYRLRQVLLNYLSNAVKFTGGGSVTTRVTVSSESEAQGAPVRLRMSVLDEGAGIAAEKIPALFRRFSQADSSVTRTFGGTGLGLAISRELMELMGGQVGVASELGRGSEFWLEVTLPRGRIAPGRDRAVRGRAVFPGRRVLVVDDVPTNRELFQEMLRQHGCGVDLAGDGAEAVEAVGLSAYDLVLMDVQMPVLDGLAATRKLRDGGFTALPIVALTASGTPEQVAACMAAGMDGHLLKPLSPQELERSLLRVFEGAALSEAATEPGEDGRTGEEAQTQAAFQNSMGAVFALNFVTKYQVQLGERFKDETREALQADAHKIAGSAGMIGLSRLGTAARRLEDVCVEGGDLQEPLGALRAESARARASLAAWSEHLKQAAAAAAAA